MKLHTDMLFGRSVQNIIVTDEYIHELQVILGDMNS